MRIRVRTDHIPDSALVVTISRLSSQIVQCLDQGECDRLEAVYQALHTRMEARKEAA